MPSLALKASINFPFIGSSSPSGYVWNDADGSNWYSRVVSAGGTITNANQAIFDAVFASMKANSNIWAKINQGYFFVGQESFGNGLFVPFYNTNTGSGLQPPNTSAATNGGAGFSSGGYGKKTGIQDVNQGSWINTGIDEGNATVLSKWPSSSGRHVYVNLGDSANAIANAFPGPGYPFGGSKSNASASVLNGDYAFDQSISGNWNSNFASICNDGTYNPYQSASFTFPASYADGGWGIPNTIPTTGRCYFYAGSGQQGYFSSATAPLSQPQSPNNILIGGDQSVNASGNTYNKIRCATLGQGGFDFSGMDTIVNTLLSNLN